MHLRELLAVQGRHQLPGTRLGGDEVLRQRDGGVSANVAEGGEKKGVLNVAGETADAEKLGRGRGLPHNHFMAPLQPQALHPEHHPFQQPRQRVGEGDLGRHFFTHDCFSQRLVGWGGGQRSK